MENSDNRYKNHSSLQVPENNKEYHRLYRKLSVQLYHLLDRNSHHYGEKL